jgi:hypothetical protein
VVVTGTGPCSRNGLRESRELALLPLTSCGAIMTSGTSLVPIESHPNGATVLHDGRCVGVTPCEAPVTVASRHLELVLDGFHPQLVDVGTERNLWAGANALNLGLGLIVDLALGTHQVPNTTPVAVYLRDIDSPPREPWVRSTAPPPEPPTMSLAHCLALIQQALSDPGMKRFPEF